MLAAHDNYKTILQTEHKIQSTKAEKHEQYRTRESAVRGTTSILAPEIIGKLINY